MSIALVHVCATWTMVGIIWMVQVVHYPLMKKVGEKSLIAYHSAHVQRISWIVIPPMLIELFTGILLLFPLGSPLQSVYIAGFFLLAAIWAITVFKMALLHKKIQSSGSAELVDCLVGWNWSRTVLWSARGMLFLFCGSYVLI